MQALNHFDLTRTIVGNCRKAVLAAAASLAMTAYADNYSVYWIGGPNAGTSLSITYATNDAGLTDYDHGTVQFSWNMSARSTERFDNGGYTLNGAGSSTSSPNCPSDQAVWSGSIHLDFPRGGPGFGGQIFTVSQSMSGRDSGNYIAWSSSTSMTASNAGNQLGTPPMIYFGGAISYKPGDFISGPITGGNNPSTTGYAIFGLTGWTDPSSWVSVPAQITNGTDSQQYSMEVYQNAWGDWNEVDNYYTITVAKASFTAPTSWSIPNPQLGAGGTVSWSPGISGGGPAQGTAFCVGGKTPWVTSAVTFTSGEAGNTYQVWVANYNDASAYTGTAVDSASNPQVAGKVLQAAYCGTITVSKAPQSISFPSPGNQTYNQSFTVNATAPGGSCYYTIGGGSANVSGNTITPTATGSLTIVAHQDGNGQYNAATPVSVTINVSKANASISLGNLNQTYDGNPKTVSVSTSPGGLSVNVTYNGGGAPTNAGSYSVNASINDANYQGSTSGTLNISPASVSFSFYNLSYTYDGSVKYAGVSANPSWATYSSSLGGGPNAGSYLLSASGTGNWSGSGSAWMTISQASPPGVTFNNGSVLIGQTIGLSASGGGSSSYNYQIASGTAATVSGSNLTGVAIGSVVLQVQSQASTDYTTSGWYSATYNVTSRTEQQIWLEWFSPRDGTKFVASGSNTAVSAAGTTRETVNNNTGNQLVVAGDTITLRPVHQTPQSNATSYRMTVANPAGTIIYDQTWAESPSANPYNICNSGDRVITIATAGTYTVAITGNTQWADPRSPSATVTYFINAQVPQPSITVSGLQDFGAAYVSSANGSPTYIEHSFAITNTGLGTLTVSAIALTGDFQLTAVNGAAPSFPFDVAAKGGSGSFTVRFAPTQNRTRTGTLTITHNAAGSPGTCILTGTGLAPQYSASFGTATPF